MTAGASEADTPAGNLKLEEAAGNHVSAGSNPVALLHSRDLVDPVLGLHWRQIPNGTHPDWPPHLELVGEQDSGKSSVEKNAHRKRRALSEATRALESPHLNRVLAVHAGDRIEVDQRSESLQASFGARALDAAEIGQLFRAQLGAESGESENKNGQVIQVQATGHGRADWISSSLPWKTEQR